VRRRRVGLPTRRAVAPGLSVRTPGSARAACRRARRRAPRHGARLDAQLWLQAGSPGGRTSVARGGAAATGAGRARAADRRCARPRGRGAPSARCEGRRLPRAAPVMQRLRRYLGLPPALPAPAVHLLSRSTSLQHPRARNGPDPHRNRHVANAAAGRAAGRRTKAVVRSMARLRPQSCARAIAPAVTVCPFVSQAAVSPERWSSSLPAAGVSRAPASTDCCLGGKAGPSR
jgi:hypothetical protein